MLEEVLGEGGGLKVLKLVCKRDSMVCCSGPKTGLLRRATFMYSITSASSL